MQLVSTHCKKKLHRYEVFLLLIACLLVAFWFVSAQDEIIDFESDRWTLQGAKVVTHLGQKSLQGSAILNDVEFANGVIEVDVAFVGSEKPCGILEKAEISRTFISDLTNPSFPMPFSTLLSSRAQDAGSFSTVMDSQH